MAGTPADLTIYKDDTTGYQLRDHTYYGNGCPSGYGSITPCETRIVQTADDDSQKNGTYYHFQAATSGSGGAITTNNTNSSDTFCPLGWQLPYSGTSGDYYDKSRSWRYLFTVYGIAFDNGTSADSTKIRSYPLSYILSGNYYWLDGMLYNINLVGNFWSATNTYITSSYNGVVTLSGIISSQELNKARGVAIRCDFDISNLEKLSMAPRKTLNILGFIKLLNEPEME